MSSTEQFLRDAMKGGFAFPNTEEENEQEIAFSFYLTNPYRILLMPIAWQAVGKMRGWKEYQHEHLVTKEKLITKIWLEQWHTFIDHLADGKSIEDSLTEISK